MIVHSVSLQGQNGSHFMKMSQVTHFGFSVNKRKGWKWQGKGVKSSHLCNWDMKRRGGRKEEKQCGQNSSD